MTRRILVMFAALAAIAVALGFYALHLKRKVARDAQAAAEQQLAMAPPGNGPPEPVTLYVANDSDGTLRKTQITVPLPAERSERDRAVLRALLAQYLKSPSPHPIGAGRRCARGLSDGRRHRHRRHEFGVRRRSSFGRAGGGVDGRVVVVTLNANDSKIGRVKILVNGQERDTLAGHADLRRFYEAGNIGQVVKDMQ